MTSKEQQRLLSILSIFIIFQPLFDILSNMYMDGLLKYSISLIVKPTFVFILGLYVFFKYNKNKKIWFLYAFLFLILILGHFFILNRLFVDTSVIIHEIRFMINIIYMIVLFMIYFTIYKYSSNKQEILINLKKTIMITFSLYSILYILAIITKTSGLTYEYSDSSKLGFKGWFDSGQILGHASVIVLPIYMYYSLKPRNKWYIRLLLLLPVIIMLMLIGTRVTYIMLLAILILYLLLGIFNVIFNKNYKFDLFNFSFILVAIIVVIGLYKYTPVYNNVQINDYNHSIDVSKYNISKMEKYDDVFNIDLLIEEHKSENISELLKYKKWKDNANEYLRTLYTKSSVHPSDTRSREQYNSLKIYLDSTLEYKIFGIGYLIQGSLALERDLFMALFSFGILGFICFLLIPIVEFIKSTIYILNNIKNCDLETYLLYLGFGTFFCISMYAGYTYIYTNFSIYLVLIVVMLKCKININETYKKNNRKVNKISFLLLHLGFGGIESATINSANALSKEYEIELISFYKLDSTQTSNINSNISIRYLYNGSPNRDEFRAAVKSKNIFKILYEGIKACIILLLKKVLVVREIRKNKSDVLVSTRMEFSKLLSRYGKTSQYLIAQEHCHHNNNIKYINSLKNDYYNIDYLFALTKSLKSDYEEFMFRNEFTKIYFVPNMLIKNNNEVSNLDSRTIISVGRLHIGKRINELVDIYSKLNIKNSNLLIIGDGEEFSSIKKQVHDLKLDNKISLLGFKNQNERDEFLCKSRVFAMTSITEGLPMVLLEAMSFGIPCIAYKTDSGVSDIIDDGVNGYIIENRNELEYIKKLGQMLNDDKLIKKLSQNALKKSMMFNEENIVKIWKKILNQK